MFDSRAHYNAEAARKAKIDFLVEANEARLDKYCKRWRMKEEKRERMRIMLESLIRRPENLVEGLVYMTRYEDLDNARAILRRQK